MNRIIYLIGLMLLFFNQINAQLITLQSPYTADNGHGTVTFSLENTNTYPVILKDVAVPLNTTAGSGCECKIFYQPTPLTTAPTNPYLANSGWTEIDAQTTNPIVGTMYQIVTVMTDVDFIIPANTTYAMAIGCFNVNSTTGRQGYHSLITPAVETEQGINLIMNNTVSYGWTAPGVTTLFNPRGFCGKLDFVKGTGPNDLAIPSLASTMDTIYCQEGMISVTVENVGENQVNNFKVQWSVNGNYQGEHVINQTLDIATGPGPSSMEIDVFSHYFADPNDIIKVWTTLPNGVQDFNMTNDTLTFVLASSDIVMVDSINITLTDGTYCLDPGQGVELDAGDYPNNPTYLWDDASTNRERTVFNSGTYTVTVANEYGCENSKSVAITINPNPYVNLPTDTLLCMSGSIVLDAGSDGVHYSWSNGEIGRYATITTPGVHTVIVQGANGCVVEKSVNVIFSNTEVPTLSGINVHNLAPKIFKFSAIGANDAITDYLWDFGDGVFSADANPTHEYATGGHYVVNLEVSNECGVIVDSVSTHVLNINDIENQKDITVYPNPASKEVHINNDSNHAMLRVELNDVKGRTVYSKDLDKHNGFQNVIDIEHLVQGIYFINVYFENGMKTIKISVQR